MPLLLDKLQDDLFMYSQNSLVVGVLLGSESWLCPLPFASHSRNTNIFSIFQKFFQTPFPVIFLKTQPKQQKIFSALESKKTGLNDLFSKQLCSHRRTLNNRPQKKYLLFLDFSIKISGFANALFWVCFFNNLSSHLNHFPVKKIVWQAFCFWLHWCLVLLFRKQWRK